IGTFSRRRFPYITLQRISDKRPEAVLPPIFPISKRLFSQPGTVLADCRSSAAISRWCPDECQAIPVLCLFVIIIVDTKAGPEFQIRKNFNISVNISDVTKISRGYII